MVTLSTPATTYPKRGLGILQLSAGATMISFSAVFVKLAHVEPTMAGFYRMLFGGLILLAIVWFRGERLYHGIPNLFIILACSLFFALDLTFWHRSIHYVGPGLATLLANFQVFFLATFGIVALGEKLNWKLLISIPLAMVGLYLIVGLSWSELRTDYKTGVLFGLITALFYGAYILTLRKAQLKSLGRRSLSTIALISLITSLIMGLEALVQKEAFHIPDLQSWWALLGYGLIAQVLGWVLIAAGVLKIEASRVGLILLLQPTLAFVWDILFFRRPTFPLEVLGAFLALFAIYLGTTSQNR
jgi:drug/metabolite transporter (DMT)-like permease